MVMVLASNVIVAEAKAGRLYKSPSSDGDI